MKTYKVINRETGEIICSELDLDMAEFMLHDYEKQDIMDGIFVKDFYQIIEE
jgi:hypothetical protein